MLALPAKIVGTFYGYAAPDEFGTFFNSSSRKVTVSVTSAGKVSAKVGSLSLSCTGLAYDRYSGVFRANMKLTSATKKKNVTYTRSLVFEFDPAADFSENSLDGRYFEYYTKKTSNSLTEDLVVQCNIVGRRNVFGYDASGNCRFEGADLAQDALTEAINSHQVSEIVFAGGSVTVTLNGSYNGVAMLAGTLNGKPFSESAMVRYETGNTQTRAYLKVWSFTLGMEITYVVTLDESGSYTENVDAPVLPAG